MATDLGVKRPLPVKGMFPRDEGSMMQRGPGKGTDTKEIGPHVSGETRNAKRNYACEAKYLTLPSYIVDHSSRKNQFPPIIFTQKDAEGVHYPHRDALVVRAVIARSGLKRMLVDNDSSVNILFVSTFDKMILDHKLMPTSTPLYEFMGDSITQRGKIALVVEMGESPQTTMNFIEFLIVDSRSAYHGVLGRSAIKELGALKEFEAVTSIHQVCMKFPTKNGVARVRGDQRGSRECYLSSIRKVDLRDIHVIIANIVMADVPGDAPSEPEDVEMIDAPPILEVLVIDEIDPHVIEYEPQPSPVEELESFSVDPRDPSKLLKVGKDLQKRRALNPERYEALKEEVQKLIQNDFIRKATYPRWVFNPVLVKKHNKKWRVCVDFTNLDKACPKDNFPLLKIDQLVDSTARHELLNFMDTYSGYNQISMHPADEEHTSFIIDRGLYCYKMMPFGLKNAGATYQRLVNKMFVDLIGKTMEIYLDNMLVKSLEDGDHITHLNNTFQILKRYGMTLNPL
ncbi:uncharacterized protein LOC111385468 [Olea europaea var. sylvestris]|uniref:uncharacterized protein LOC111385468 n=1 Tax=Olea europaea var. sylvestris TaxID=158386 RepID=UPI000C1D3A67|nr:uncharacterized protein LOC111385468 [Olea europaea var. sylvestris]